MSELLYWKQKSDEEHGPRTPLEILEKAILARLTKYKNMGKSKAYMYQRLFPNTILDTDVQEKIIATLISGNHLLLFGPPGSGKTNLIKDIVNLLPKNNYSIQGCPIHDSPHSLIDANFSKKMPPCPICRERFSASGARKGGKTATGMVDQKNIPVETFVIREGHGFARIQGSPEVFPDNLTGTLNLHMLEKVGDPTSPKVIQPGKLLQANRGVLLIDEIGKLPHGTQNVLLQALQEATITPAKSRESFPTSFIAIATSNLTDLDAINEPLNDRLTNIYVGYNKEHYKNKMIIDLNLKKLEKDVLLPEIFLEATVFLVEEWRRKSGDIYEFKEVGSNRTMIDIVTRTRSYAKLMDSDVLSLGAYRKGVRDVMMGRIRARGEESFFENKKTIEEFARNYTGISLDVAAKKYWCNFYTRELSSDPVQGKKTLRELERIAGNEKMMASILASKKGFAKFRAFYRYVMKRERNPGTYEGIVLFNKVYELLKNINIFECGP